MGRTVRGVQLVSLLSVKVPRVTITMVVIRIHKRPLTKFLEFRFHFEDSSVWWRIQEVFQ